MWGLDARHPKANKTGQLVDRKACFISDPSNWVGRVDICLKANCPITPAPRDKQRVRAFIDRGRGLRAEPAQSALKVSFRLLISGLTSVVLIVLGTVHLQCQGGLLPFL